VRAEKKRRYLGDESINKWWILKYVARSLFSDKTSNEMYY
jgi:hypothetical protein